MRSLYGFWGLRVEPGFVAFVEVVVVGESAFEAGQRGGPDVQGVGGLLKGRSSAAGRCSFGLSAPFPVGGLIFGVRVVIVWRLFRRSTPDTREPILIGVGFGGESTGALLCLVDFAKDDAGFAR
jgi:hypothetical protein